jgi:D-3-phosphoglycerate dehydrogenase
MNPTAARKLVVTPPMLVDYLDAFEPLYQAGISIEYNRQHYPMDAATLVQFIGNAEMAVIGLDEVAASVFSACPDLRIIARNGVGLDNVDLVAADQHQVVVTAPYGANSISVAELTFGLLLALQRRIVSTHLRVQNHIWRREIGVEIAGKTLGIIGLGRIGKLVARRALAFDLNVIAHDIAPDRTFADQFGITFVSREALLQAADIISLHVPLTNHTHHMIDRAAFQQMKASAVLLNTARGAIVDAVALAQALDQGQIAGAALDVHTVEGQVEEFLLDRENVVTTTHLGAYTHESLLKTTRAAVKNLLQYINGDQPDGLVNLASMASGQPDIPSKSLQQEETDDI